MMTNDAFIQRLANDIAPEAKFTPNAYYDPDGDCIEFVAVEGPFYAERIDRWVTVYYSQETDDLVGSQIKGMKQFFKCYPQIRALEIHDGHMSVAHLFRAIGWSSDEREAGSILVYKKLIEAAEETETTVELEECCS